MVPHIFAKMLSLNYARNLTEQRLFEDYEQDEKSSYLDIYCYQYLDTGHYRKNSHYSHQHSSGDDPFKARE